ncbi:ferredoxin [Novosphingobium sp. PASSN1]|uniref:ferredoxin n=1 Tax=Novosphingobium sp. PASSN1 TaxID=2015561 RepID=UPI000BD78995|nr:ferredoxin [Novosphingobium sp. PASSN1]OYU34748.1 MAG: ferredoxin [Novosphingobium sp. PASSN1]
MSSPHLAISIDHATCIGSGNCVANAPGVFEQDDDGLPHVIDAGAQLRELIEFAVLSCPVRAISINDL